jgi:hypothetical protein
MGKEKTLQQMIADSVEADRIHKLLTSTDSINEVADIVDSLSEDMAKLVLKKFVFSQGQ